MNHQTATGEGSKAPLRIGITGGIGAGKSTVCKVFKVLGIPVYDADSRAKRVLTEDVELLAQIRQHFGPEAYFPDGSLNRAWLAAQVFPQPERLALLNSLVHPRVAQDFEQWCLQQPTVPYLLKEAALIFETGGEKSLDGVIHVSAPEALRIRRTLMRDEHRSLSQVEEIVKRQLPEQERISRAQYKITNDDQSLVVPQVLRLHRQLLSLAGEKATGEKTASTPD